MKTIQTPIGPGVLVGRLTGCTPASGARLLVMYSKRVLDNAVAAGYEKFMPYLGGPTVLFAWLETEIGE